MRRWMRRVPARGTQCVHSGQVPARPRRVLAEVLRRCEHAAADHPAIGIGQRQAQIRPGLCPACIVADAGLHLQYAGLARQGRISRLVMVNAVGSCQAGRLQRNTPHSAPSQARLPASAASRARSASTPAGPAAVPVRRPAPVPAWRRQCAWPRGAQETGCIPSHGLRGRNGKDGFDHGRFVGVDDVIARSRFRHRRQRRFEGARAWAGGMSCIAGSGVRESVAGAASPSDVGAGRWPKGGAAGSARTCSGCGLGSSGHSITIRRGVCR